MNVGLSTLGEEATIIMGQSPPGDSYNRNGTGIPLLNGPSEFGLDHPREVQWTTSPTKFCQAGDVLFCVRGATAGRLNMADKEYCIGRGLAAIRVKSGRFDSGFLKYVLANGYARFQARGVGSTFINISAEELMQFPVPSLPLPEQRGIAAILDQADALRAKRRQALAKLDTLTHSFFREIFGNPADNPTAKLVSVCELITDGEHLTPRRSPDGLKLLSARNIQNGFLDFSDVDYVDEAEFARITTRCRPQRGDILLSCSGTIGRASAVRTDEPLSLVRSAALIRPKQALVRTDYMEAWLLLPWMAALMRRRANASSQANLFQNQIKELPIFLPDIALQDCFIKRSKLVRENRKLLVRHVTELDSLFSSLQHRAFRGEL